VNGATSLRTSLRDTRSGDADAICTGVRATSSRPRFALFRLRLCLRFQPQVLHLLR
jgi:hypothetical protein